MRGMSNFEIEDHVDLPGADRILVSRIAFATGPARAAADGTE